MRRFSIEIPLAWYPRLVYATQAERDNWALISEGEGIHWPDLDEDLSEARADSRMAVARIGEVFHAVAQCEAGRATASSGRSDST